jgi:preprotein translocase subunit SecG
MKQLIEQLDLYFGKKAPQLPTGAKEIIVKFGPYVAIIGLIVAGLGILAIIPFLLGTSMMGAYGAYGAAYAMSSTTIWLALIFGIASLVLEIMALPGLFKRNITGWTFIFYAELVALVHSLVSFNFVGLVIGAVIGFYILFQVRPYYTGAASISEAPVVTPPTPPSSPVPPVPPAQQ